MRFLDLTLNILAASRLLQLSITISLRGELAKPLITVQSLYYNAFAVSHIRWFAVHDGTWSSCPVIVWSNVTLWNWLTHCSAALFVYHKHCGTNVWIAVHQILTIFRAVGTSQQITHFSWDWLQLCCLCLLYPTSQYVQVTSICHAQAMYNKHFYLPERLQTFPRVSYLLVDGQLLD
jgi:hypothetical protein